MSKLEKAYIILQEMENLPPDLRPAVDTRAQLIAIIFYLCLMLSVPLGRPSILIVFSLIPIIYAATMRLSYGGIFLNSLFIVPLAALIGCFNPFFERTTAFMAFGKVEITLGWLSFFSIILRGILSVQMLLILIKANGFFCMCRSLQRLGVPSFITEQLFFIYRYLSVFILEALSMRRARESRGYGKKTFPLKLWGIMTGQLFLRAIDRAERINKAMLARGFDGKLRTIHRENKNMNGRSWVFLIAVCSLSLVIRYLPILYL